MATYEHAATPPTLEQMHATFDWVAQMVRGWYTKEQKAGDPDPEAAPTLFFFKTKPEGGCADLCHYMVVADLMGKGEQGKRAIVKLAEAGLASGACNFVVFLSEAYLLHTDKDSEEAQAVDRGERPSIKDNPKRIEAIVLAVHRLGMPTALAYYDVKREADGAKTVVNVLNHDGFDGNVKVGGVLTNGELNPPKKDSFAGSI